MTRFAADDILTGGSLIDDLDYDLVDLVLKKSLSPENMNFGLATKQKLSFTEKDVSGDKYDAIGKKYGEPVTTLEHFYKIPYQKDKISDKLMAELQQAQV